jgi:hypothetical protein
MDSHYFGKLDPHEIEKLDLDPDPQENGVEAPYPGENGVEAPYPGDLYTSGRRFT